MASPTLLIRYSTDDPDDPSPTWTTVNNDDVRSFDTDRGRESELSEVDAGTATIVLNNGTGSWDTTTNALLRPMNRWNIQAVLPNATTEDVFVGYVESYEMQWPGGGHDAVTIVMLADEMKVLALDAMPATDPPRDSYQDLVMFDNPTGYWPMLFENGTVSAVVGEPLNQGGVNAPTTGAGAILGQADPASTQLTTNRWLQTPVLTDRLSGDAGALSAFTIEVWFASLVAPTSTELLISGPQGIPSHTFTWKLSLNTSELLVFEVKNQAGTTHTVTSTTAITGNVFAHVVCTIEGGNVRIYINGVQEASTAWTGGVIEQMDNGYTMIVGNAGTTIGAKFRTFDEMAFYRAGLTAARVVAHYNAGTARGFVDDQTGDRITAILDSIGSIAPRSIDQGGYNVQGLYMVGQNPLSEIRSANQCEPADSLFFIGKDGTITYRFWEYRVLAPYDTVQATFDDDGTDLPFIDVTIDYSDAFLINEWNITPDGQPTETASDATSIGLYLKRSQFLSLPMAGFGSAPFAARMLAKYKDPMTRITSLTLKTKTDALCNEVFPLEIGDRIRVFVTQPAGVRIDQTLFIQKIAVSGGPNKPWDVQLGVSPL